MESGAVLVDGFGLAGAGYAAACLVFGDYPRRACITEAAMASLLAHQRERAPLNKPGQTRGLA